MLSSMRISQRDAVSRAELEHASPAWLASPHSRESPRPHRARPTLRQRPQIGSIGAPASAVEAGPRSLNWVDFLDYESLRALPRVVSCPGPYASRCCEPEDARK